MVAVNQKLPNFIIIGAAKSGTTSFFRYLGQHPDIYVSPKKETNFFAYAGQTLDFHYWGEPPTSILNSITDFEQYQTLFAEAGNERAIGEASPLYLFHEDAPGRIFEYLPRVKLIAILRHPAERAFSHYSHLIRDGREPCQIFSEALQVEPQRIVEGWVWDYYYQQMGYYYRQLCRYFQYFDRRQIKIFLYEDFKDNPIGTLQETYRFLDVDDRFVPDTTFRHNISGKPRSQVLMKAMSHVSMPRRMARLVLPKKTRRQLVTRIREKNLVSNELSATDRKNLSDQYRQDIQSLATLIDRDLSAWLN